MSRRALLLAAALLLPASALGQEGFVPMHRYGRTSQMVAAGWEASVPLPELYERMQGDKSFTGAIVEARFGVARGVSIGAGVTWNRYETPTTIARPARFEAISPRATIHYYPLSGIVQPYVGVGVGGVHRAYVVDFAGIEQRGWGWAVDPQLGLLVTVDQGLAINILARYQITNAWLTPDVPRRAQLENPSWVGLSVGVALF